MVNTQTPSQLLKMQATVATTYSLLHPSFEHEYYYSFNPIVWGGYGRYTYSKYFEDYAKVSLVPHFVAYKSGRGLFCQVWVSVVFGFFGWNTGWVEADFAIYPKLRNTTVILHCFTWTEDGLTCLMMTVSSNLIRNWQTQWNTKMKLSFRTIL